ncbi:unnamed protein product [Adineta steineri]|uniref:Acyltransferase 3 domain-containing protein n=1 Tax=Adineta steineri TaxID=433720 RepID=A0A813MJE1_9BILA|nr:unnamed protein product [Adineta steineri]
MLILGESQGGWIRFWLFYQNYISIEQCSWGFVALWSVSLDMQMHIILPIILHIVTSSKVNYQRTYLALYILVILSIVYSMLVFNPKTMDLLVHLYHNNVVALGATQQFVDWVTVEYNVTLGFEKVLDPSPLKSFMELIYMPVLGRYSSFIIGSILAFNLINVKNNAMIRYGTIKKYTYLTFIFLYMIILTIPPKPNAVSDVVLTIMVSIVRQIFAIAQAFILFSAICPPTHPYYSPWIRSFLSHPIWTPIAKLSYLIYVIHCRIALELIMTHSHIFNPTRYSIDVLTIICLILVFIICLIISVIWFIFVEKPFQRLINKQLSSYEKLHAI